MNFQLFNFSQEIFTDMLKFRKVANEMKTNNYCNLVNYNKMKHVFQSGGNYNCDPESKQEFIYIASSDDEDKKGDTSGDPENFRLSDEGANTTLIKGTSEHDLVFAIKENLETKLCLNSCVLESLNELSRIQLKNVFKLLKEELNSDQIRIFGLSLQDTVSINETVIEHFLSHLLLIKLSFEYTDGLQSLLERYVNSHTTMTEVELSNILLENEDYGIILQYVLKLSLETKSNLFGKFIFRCNKLEARHIEILQTLISPHLHYNDLNNLIDLIVKNVNDFNTDKSFGKLVMAVIQLLGKNASLLQQPLKHIIGVHKSIWKAKLQKEFNACLDENSSSQRMK